MKKRAFTLIELLVVIAIIGLLSSIVLASLQNARHKANVIKTVRDLKNIEQALYLYHYDRGLTEWIHERGIEGGTDMAASPFIDVLVDEIPGLGEFLSVAPRSPLSVTSSNEYSYDNDSTTDGDGFTCGVDVGATGVGILIFNVPDEDIEDVDKILDNDNDISCGKVRRHVISGPTDVLVYSLADYYKDF